VSKGTLKKEKANKRRIKRLMLQIDILNEDLDESKEIYDECEIDFRLVVGIVNQYFNKSRKENTQDGSGSVDESSIAQDEKVIVPAWAKNLYRGIVKETHPDKIIHLDISEDEKQKRGKAYILATDALNRGKVANLLEEGLNLNIPVDLNIEEISSFLFERMTNIKKEISDMMSSSSWIWFHSDDGTRIKIIEHACKSQGVIPTESDINKIMLSINERDFTVLTSRKPRRKAGTRPPQTRIKKVK